LFGFCTKVFLGFCLGKDIEVDGHNDVDKETNFIEQIQDIHQAVQEHLERSQAKYKAWHEKHYVEHNFQGGDQVGLYISKERLQGEGRS